MEYRCKYYLVDIDGTITDYRPGALAPEKLVGGNFLFPIFRDLMVERGWDKLEAEARIIQLTRDVVYWDYTDFMVEFDLPVAETYQRLRAWHRENLFVYERTVELLRHLHQGGRKLFVMSNNPYVGCLLKLEAAGLADTFSAPCFTRVFGTNLLRGCKNDPEVWKRALAQIPAPRDEIGTIGDNPLDDGELPRSLGVGETVIIPRDSLAPGAF